MSGPIHATIRILSNKSMTSSTLNKSLPLWVFVLLWSAWMPAQAQRSGEVQRDHVVVELVSEVEAVTPGQPFRVGLSLRHAPDWHTYWRNPGDSGLETRIDWTLPDGFAAGEIQWPYPERHVIEHLVNFGYSGNSPAGSKSATRHASELPDSD